MLAVNDPAGTAIEFQKALNAHSGRACRLITLETRYNFDYEADIHIPDAGPERLAEVEALFRGADVLHFHMTADERLPFGPFLPKDFMAGKKIVHHHHGHPDFRGNPEKYRKKYRDLGRKNLLVSTPDLLRLLPGARWQPNLVPVDAPDYLPPAGEEAPPLRVAHSPTRKDLKNTDDFIRVCGELRDEGVPAFVSDIIELTPHRECLARKRRAAVVFDHMQGYYGVSSLEALSQGRPVIAGLDDFNLEHVRAFAEVDRVSDVPWVLARTPEQLKDRLRALLRDKDLRLETGRRSRAFMEKRWSPEKGAERLAAFYETLS